MILRPYQQNMVHKAADALSRHGNTLAVAPTGAGKTVILSALAGRVGGHQCILQHREELVAQNLGKYRTVNPGRRVSLFTADVKSWNGDAVFAMSQTLVRNLSSIPKLDLLVIDEAHHSISPSYLRIIDAVKDKNPACKIFGVTATPARGDGKGLRKVFDNCCDQISLHSLHVAAAFRADGVNADVVSGDMPAGARAALLKDFDNPAGRVQVLVNVAVLTEGFDSPPVSCVVLLRPCSYKSTMLQMIGRGLRTVDPACYPGVVKTDCLVLDFGRSLATHRDLESKAKLDDRQKRCPACQADVPCSVRECPLCGHEFKGAERVPGSEGEGDGPEVVSNVFMEEVDLLDASPFRWCDVFGGGKVMLASGFEAWSAVCSADGERWLALGKLKGDPLLRRLAVGERIPALAAADDFLRMNESDDAAKKNRRWLNDAATGKQWEHLQHLGHRRAADRPCERRRVLSGFTPGNIGARRSGVRL